jgi:MFS family permease
VFLVGLIIFTLSSLTAGLAGSAGVLIAARAVQGFGAALVLPATLAIIAAAFTDARERTAAIGISGAADAPGPPRDKASAAGGTRELPAAG